MRRLLVVLMLFGLVLSPLSVAAQSDRSGGDTARIQLYALQIVDREVQVLFRVIDQRTGRDVAGLQAHDIQLLENDVVVAGAVDLTEQRVDAANPAQEVALPGAVEGSATARLSVIGSTIGVVYDASTLINSRDDPTNYLERGRVLIEAFLEAGRPVAPSNPEALSLFVPLSVPTVAGETIQPADLREFSQDRNQVINAIRQQVPRQTKTNVFDTISTAVQKTAEAAGRRAADAYVLVVTDGGDTASSGSYDALVQAAIANKVRLLILGIGPPARIAQNTATLTTLAEQTGGAFLANPEPRDVQQLYQQQVGVAGQSAYIVRYTTALIDDGRPDNLVVRIDGPVRARSAPVPIVPNTQFVSGPLAPLGDVLQGYALRAAPLAVVVSLLLAGLLALIKRITDGRTRSGLSGGVTRT